MEMNLGKGQFTSQSFVITSEHYHRYQIFWERIYPLCVDLNTSQNTGELSLVENGTIQLEGQLDRELPESVQVIIYGEYQSCVTIDAARAAYHTKI